MTERERLSPTPTEPGWAALSSCRHAYGTIQTAIARLTQNGPDWSDDQVAEARAQLEAAGELVRAVGEALRRST